MTLSTAKKHFWQWFQQNHENYNKLYKKRRGELKYMQNELSMHVRAYCRNLEAELEWQLDGSKKRLIITAHGRSRYFSRADQLVAIAPDIPGWEILSLCPPVPASFGIEQLCSEMGINPEEWWFKPKKGCRTGTSCDIIIYTDKYHESTHDAMRVVARVAVINILGERSAAQDIGEVQVLNLSDAAGEKKLSKINRLPHVIGNTRSIADNGEVAGFRNAS